MFISTKAGRGASKLKLNIICNSVFGHGNQKLYHLLFDILENQYTRLTISAFCEKSHNFAKHQASSLRIEIRFFINNKLTLLILD